MSLPLDTTSTITPALRYRDANAAIAWLVRAFGFVEKAVYRDEGGCVVHAQLTFGNGMVMLSEASRGHDDEWARLIAQPEEIGGRETQCCCVAVADPDAHYANAVANGAKIIYAIADQDYGGRGYGCADPEGHIWWFGSYDPWAE